MDVSDGIDKSWDHPWSTEEMRKKRREWSLAGDVGLLKHLQQFSENLVSKANKTQTALDTLATQLKETGILVDNVTNTSLALANTQFIESRVQEDDIELKGNLKEKQQETKPQDSTPENLIASISESVKQGLRIMDEKYKVMDVACSDSEEEDDGGVVFSVIVGPNDPYQDRSLPYVIGSDKWMASDKIGLESSSSESEQADEEEREESESDEREDVGARKVLNGRHNPEANVTILSSSSDSDYNDPDSNAPYMSNEAVSRNNINSASESVTPNNVSKTSSEATPNFAEELAKRLGTVRQSQKPATMNEAGESSINRFKDDLFASKKNDDVFSEPSDNLFGDEKGLFDDQVSANLWKDRPIRSYKSSNIIPPSIDVPPPISIVSTKPKSEIDDLFADADSEDDSDIFSARKPVKKPTAKEPTASDSAAAGTEDVPKKFLDVIAPRIAGVTTSTPETKVNSPSLFSDDENDDADLFGNPKKQSRTPTSAPPSTNTTRESSKKKPAGTVSIFSDALASDIERKLSSRIMQRRRESSESSDSEAPGISDSARSNAEAAVSAVRGLLDDNIAVDRSPIAENPVQDISAINETTDNSSGISMRPASIDNTAGSGLWNFHPEMSSTRLKSEEIYRERIASDSLFAARTLDPAISVNSNSNQQQQQPRQEQQNVSSAFLQDDVFENDDLFGPPPLPSKTDSKRTTKSKVSSLFDDSDSGDELFSAASSGSRSQKSTDFFAATSSNDKAKPPAKGSGLFDDDMDIFGGKDAPDVDIFGATLKSKSTDEASDGLFGERGQDSTAPKTNNVDQSQNVKTERKKMSLFDDDNDGDDGDLFSTKPTRSKSERKSDLFEDENDLFSGKTNSKERTSAERDALTEPKTDVSKNVPSLETEKRSEGNFLENKLFSDTTKTRGLLFEDDDYDDLFSKKVTVMHEDDRSRSKSKEEVEKDVAEEAQKASKENKNPTGFSDVNRVAAAISDSDIVGDVSDERHKTDVEEASASVDENDGATKKNSPPRTLNIQTTTSPSIEEQGNQQQVPRRSVSGKIKNLMGKMGDLKILSPMDAPPLWRKSEDKTDEDEDAVDSDSGGRTGRVSPPSVSEGSARKESSYSTISTTSNAEAAISFDDLAQVETLSTTASKSRVRIQAKRRPQSRHARKSALRHSGIDFDTVDNAQDNSQEESHASVSSSIKDSFTAPGSAANRLATGDTHRSTIDPCSVDDKSELGSISKESSMSVNKNTLLSPSTDEEDLFDVPPDLPEDPQKEDTLFGRAPILSPIDGERSDKPPITAEPLADTAIGKVDDDVENDVSASDDKDSELTRSDIKSDACKSHEKRNEKREEVDDERSEAKEESSAEEPSDPLRDSSHDPLKDPSQLFAFVTKTPSPEKSKSLLFSEPDDSLFSSAVMKKSSEPKKILDLFADDDVGGDLFSSVPSKKTLRKPLRDTKIGLFGDDDGAQDDSLFGSTSSKTKLDNQKPSLAPVARKRNNIFDDDDDDDSSLFVESSGQSQKSDSASFSESKPDPADNRAKSSNLKNIFGDAPCDDDDDLDLFATKKVVPKKIAAPSKSLFADDDDDGDDGHIFGKQSTALRDSKTAAVTESSRPAVKKPVTRDLKKTAEKIVEDPLSLLQDD